MSKVTQPPDIGRITEQPEFNRNAAIVISDIVSAINGNLDFSTNINCVTVSGTIVANTELSVSHKLGRVPQGRIVVKQSCQDAIYDGSTSWTTTNIYVSCKSGGTFSLILY